MPKKHTQQFGRRGFSPPPREVQEIIDFVNLVAPQVGIEKVFSLGDFKDLPQHEREQAAFKANVKTESDRIARERAAISIELWLLIDRAEKEACSRLGITGDEILFWSLGADGIEVSSDGERFAVGKLPKVLLNFGGGCDDPNRLCEAAAELIHEWRLNLIEVARAARGIKVGGTVDAPQMLPAIKGKRGRYLILWDSSDLTLDDNGIVRVCYNSAFFDAMDGVVATRIRECAKCARIFWAGRKDQRCCSLRCSRSSRKRRYRASEREKETRVLKACTNKPRTEEEVSEETGIDLDEVKRCVEKLTEQGKVEWTELRIDHPKFQATALPKKRKKGR